MPGNPTECREHAKRCLYMATTASSTADRERFEALAARWLALATDLELAEIIIREWGTPKPDK